MVLLDLAQEAGLNPKWVAGTHGGEYHSACPACGGTDRFRINPYKQQKNCTGYYCCRQCEIYGDTIQFARDFLGLSYEDAVIRAGSTQQEKGINLAHFAPKPQSFRPTKSKAPVNDVWLQGATTFVERSHAQLLLQPEQLAKLQNRGIPRDAAVKYNLGWNSEEQYLLNAWGLDKRIWLPKGLVIPLARGGQITGVKIRRHDFKEGDEIGKYIAIPGGFDGFSFYGEIKNRDIIAIVESELDAIALQHAVGNLCFTIAIGGNNKNPDFLTDHLAKSAKQLLVIYDNDDGGMTMLAKWQSLYPHACPYSVPFGKDIGEAAEQGLQIREWFLATLASFKDAQIASQIPTVIEPQLSETTAPTTITVQTKTWSPEAQELVVWFSKYVEYIKTHSPQTHHNYADIEQGIAKGPEGDHVEPFIYKLRMMKQTIEQAPMYNGSPFHAFMVK